MQDVAVPFSAPLGAPGRWVGSSPPPALSCSAALGSPCPCARSYAEVGWVHEGCFIFCSFFFLFLKQRALWPSLGFGSSCWEALTPGCPSQAAVPGHSSGAAVGSAQQEAVSSGQGMDVRSAGDGAALALLRMAAFAFVFNFYCDRRACVKVLRVCSATGPGLWMSAPQAVPLGSQGPFFLSHFGS